MEPHKYDIILILFFLRHHIPSLTNNIFLKSRKLTIYSYLFNLSPINLNPYLPNNVGEER